MPVITANIPSLIHPYRAVWFGSAGGFQVRLDKAAGELGLRPPGGTWSTVQVHRRQRGWTARCPECGRWVRRLHWRPENPGPGCRWCRRVRPWWRVGEARCRPAVRDGAWLSLVDHDPVDVRRALEREGMAEVALTRQPPSERPAWWGEVARMLGEGASIGEAAAACGVTWGTARRVAQTQEPPAGEGEG